MTSGMEWQFGGWLQGMPPAVAWGLLALIGAAGLALIIFSYRHTLRSLSSPARWGLSALRIALLLGVLACLANPVRIEKTAREKKPPRKLAVLVDRSASMDAVDNRNETRLGNALRIWRQHDGETKEKFDLVNYYRFSSKADPIPSLDDAAKTGASGEATHLYDAVEQVLADSPAAVVCLTDGLDTSRKTPAGLAAHAQRNGVPLYFVAANNRSRPGEFLNIRELQAPSQVLRQTRFSTGIAVEVAATKAGDLPVELWSGDEKLAETLLKVRAGWNSLPWSVDVTSGEAGVMPLEFRVGRPGRQEVSASTTRVIEKATVDVLYYQGALQWGYRFLLASLQSDPSFKMASILNPALGMKMTIPAAGHTALNDLPDNAAELKPYQIVVLAHAFADQFSQKQQQALVEYVKNGGGVLFITPETGASQEFAGTLLEQMLPIIFEPRQHLSEQDVAAQAFQAHMQAIGGSRSADETVFAEDAMSRQEIQPLTPFVPPSASSRARLFQSGSNAPQFNEYAKVKSPKAGAEVIAVHPRDRSATGAPRVLIARQQFGQGFAAAMTTDLLWRWKLSLPSTSRMAETFWQQFMLSLAPTSPGRGLRLTRIGEGGALSRPVTVWAESPGSDAPKIVAISPAGNPQVLTVREKKDQQGGWEASFIPEVDGRWEVTAETAADDHAKISLPISRQAQTEETANLPPDVEGMRQLAEVTGGALIDQEAVAFPVPPAVLPAPEVKRALPLWNRSSLILLLLGFYGTELVARRLFRLL